MVESLQERHASQILTFVFSRGRIKKTDLLEIVSSSDSLSKTLRKLQDDGLIIMETKVIGRKTIYINLTDKGQAVAEQLKKAEQVAEGGEISEFLTDDMKVLIYLLNEKEARYESLKGKFGSAYSSVSRLKQMKLIDVRIDNKKYPSEEIISLTDKGRKVAEKLKEIEEILNGEK
jgi:DNA-binding MarR family transcriptional regulator